MSQLDTWTAYVDPATGDLHLEDLDPATWQQFADLLPPPVETACGKPRPSAFVDLAPYAAARPSPHMLRVSRLYYGSVAEGPGRRSVVELQGCPLQCPGCPTPWMIPARGGHALTPWSLARALTEDASLPRDGVTILAGDVFLQAGPLNDLCFALKLERFPSSHLCLHTGRTFEEIVHHPLAYRLLEYLDLMMLGRYERTKTVRPGAYLESSNQEVWERRETGWRRG